MIDENLEDVLDATYQQEARKALVRNLSERTHLTLGQIALLIQNPKHGQLVESITLAELFETAAPNVSEEEEEEEEVATTKKATKKATKTVSKKATKKESKKATKKATKTASKADKGKPKPRLDYETGMKEVLSALRAAKEPVGRGAIETATGYSAVQVRSFCVKLKEAGKIKVLGSGGRSTKYQSV